MSRLAKKPIAIIPGITASRNDGYVVLKGPKGERELSLLPFVEVTVGTNEISVKSTEDHKQARTNTGTMWSLIKNAVQGLAVEFSKVLEIEGVGYRASLEGDTLILALGYVNPVRFKIPDSVKISVEKNAITILGKDKELVGKTASQIRGLKPPEPYKGKGIHYRGEAIRRKVGKKAATATAA